MGLVLLAFLGAAPPARADIPWLSIRLVGGEMATYIGNHISIATVTWNQAANGYRLLTEAEWEYACRATSTTAFCNGSITRPFCSPLDPNLDQVGWYCGNASSATHDVGSKTANAWGLKDMHGNVWEYCWDLYGDYPAGPLTDPTGPVSGFNRVIRGGSWTADPRYCRSARRYYTFTPGDWPGNFGLRVARTAS
jgi:formylglycine-generating enzyme required for sulfatase activity